jgi:hypothetical protein
VPKPATRLWAYSLNYAALTAAIDRAFAGPADTPLPLADLFAELEEAARPTPLPLAADATPPAAPEPG